MKMYFVMASLLIFNVSFAANSRIRVSTTCHFEDQLGSSSLSIEYASDDEGGCYGIPSFDLDCTESIEGIDVKCLSVPGDIKYFNSNDSKLTKVAQAKVRILRSLLVNKPECAGSVKNKKLFCVEMKLTGSAGNSRIRDAVLPTGEKRSH